LAQTFDPYHIWLGIPRAEQPPNYYRLLGISVFEENAEVILDAADQRMAHVRTKHLSQHVEISQRILSEIVRAKICLLDPHKKASYDALLRNELSLRAAAVMPPLPPRSAVPTARSWTSAAAMGAGAICFALLAILVVNSRGKVAAPVAPRGTPSSAPRELKDSLRSPYASTATSSPVAATTTPAADGALMFNSLEPAWAPVDSAMAEQIRAGRERTLQHLEQVSWPDLVAKATGYMIARRPTDRSALQNTQSAGDPTIPLRFILTGQLQAVRVQQGRAVVYLCDSTGDAQKRPFYIVGGLDVRRAAIEFRTSELPLWMADYRSGDRIRLAVRREASAAPTDPTPSHQGARAARYQSEYRPAFPAGLVWRFLGEGLEKADAPDTWIDPQLGRIAQVTNRTAILQSISYLLRCPETAERLRGQVRGKLVDVSGSPARLRVGLEVETVEGSCPCAAEFNGEAKLSEFLDYPKGAPVTLQAEVVGNVHAIPGAGTSIVPNPQVMMSPSMRGRELLPNWSGLWFKADRIELTGRPATVISSTGPRRTGVAWSAITPDVAHALGVELRGKEVRWEGSLDGLRRCGDETHLLVKLSDSLFNLPNIEAYSRDRNLLEDLADYQPAISFSQPGDAVLVRGILVDDEQTRYRFVRNVPLIEIREVQCANHEPRRVVVGQRRNPQPKPCYAPNSLAAILRDYPPGGTEVTFEAHYKGFDKFDLSVRVGIKDGPRDVSVSLSRATEADFKDYRYDDPVVVKAVAAELNSALSETPKMMGKSIVRIGPLK
jgi:hypothetical protein